MISDVNEVIAALGLDPQSVCEVETEQVLDTTWASWVYLIERLKTSRSCHTRQVLRDKADMIIHSLLEDLPFYPRPACGEEAAKLNALSLEQEISRLLSDL